MTAAIANALQQAWDGIGTLPPLAFSETEAAALAAALSPCAYPANLTPALAEVLGQPNFQLHPIWMALREVGVEIKTRYEDEAAAAIHFLIPIALLHGLDWQHHAADRLLELRDELQARQADS